MSGESLLAMRSINKRFGDVFALNNVDFDLARGEIHALLGVNGAGKSTLIKILSGVYSRDGGTILINGKDHPLGSPRAAIEAGIAVVQQHPELVGDLSGAENIFLGQETARTGLFSPIDHDDIRRQAAKLLERFPIEIDLDRPVADMTAVDREIVAVLHALRVENSRILILDEPTSTLTEREKQSLFSIMKTLKAQGLAIIYITHHLDEVYEIADRFTVFRGGHNVASYTTEDAREQKVSIPHLMLDTVAGSFFPPHSDVVDGEVVFEVRGLARYGDFGAMDLIARKGEIIGIFGLSGSGIDEFSKTLFGVLKPDEGEIRLHGQPVQFRSPADALKKGVFLVPGDRRTEGLSMEEDVVFNTTLANLGRASLGGLLRFGRNRRDARVLADQVDLQPPSLNRSLRSYSGGNQQKIVVAKGLYRQASVYIFVEPTVGVDIGAQAKIYNIMRELSKNSAVIIMSSDCDEVYGVADRTIALCRGEPIGTLAREVSRDTLLHAGLMGEIQQ